MRIAMMADVYKPHISGVTNHISLSKAYLEKAGHDVYVFTFKYQQYQDEEKNIIRSAGIPVLDTGFNINWRYSREARSLLQTMDVVHVHHPFISGPLAIRYCRSRGIPIVFTNHTRYDLYAQAYLPAMTEGISETVLESYLPGFCRAMDMVIAPSPGMREVLKSFGVDSEIFVVPNGVDLNPFRYPGKRVERSIFGFTDQDILLIFVGRLGPEKNLQFLLRAFTGALQAYPNLGLLLVGEGPEKESLQERVSNSGIEGRVYFTGLVPYESLPGYLGVADAFVTASVTEVHPLSVIEAMASGLPVLGIQSPGVGDTVIDDYTGFLVADQDLAAFTAKLVRLSTDHSKRQEMGQQALLAAEQYDILRTIQLMVECYQQVILEKANRKRGWRNRLNQIVKRQGKT
jgi:glycosyltransferase involved in cell wall biosynthesis